MRYGKLKAMKLSALIVAFAMLISWPRPSLAADNASREFVMSCTYGVLAGTLVGAASLAFTSKPGESLQRVARGASLGLYAGILLGLYVVYVIPSMETVEDEDPLARLDQFSFRLSPTLHENKLDGFVGEWTVYRF